MARPKKSDKSKARAIAMVPALYLGFACYLGYHTVQGDRGLVAWFSLTEQVESLERDVAVVSAERERLELRVSHLQRDNLDLDLLEERARVVLNLGHPDDRIILRPGLGD